MTAASPEPWTIMAVLKWAADYFKEKGVPEPRASAEVLLAHALNLTRLDLYLRFDQPLTSEELARFKALVVRRREGEPTAYLTGHKEFWSLDFIVTPAVLIPRPETEVLVEAVLEGIKGIFRGGGQGLQTPAPSPKPPSPTPVGADPCVRPGRTRRCAPTFEPGESEPKAQPSPAPIKGVGRGVWGEGGGAALPRPFPHKPLSLLALEVGAGSGAVVIALARELPELKWVAVDISGAALKVAQENARRHALTGRIHFIQADLLSGLKPEGRFALLAANLPYVTRAAWEVLPRGIWDYEPRQAIEGGEDGLDLLRPLAREAHRYLAPGGVLALEMDPEQTEVIGEILRQTESYREIEIIPDYRGLARVVRGIRK